MPSPLRVDSHHSRVKRERLGAAIAQDFEGRRTLHDVDEFVATAMDFPVALSRPLSRLRARSLRAPTARWTWSGSAFTA